MCTIGGFYMTSIYFDFVSVGSITSPTDCQKFKASKYTTIIIWSGATCDAIWNIFCLLLFFFRLRKLTKSMTATQNIAQNINKNMKKGGKSDLIPQFLPILVKLSILSFWCAFS